MNPKHDIDCPLEELVKIALLCNKTYHDVIRQVIDASDGKYTVSEIEAVIKAIKACKNQ